MQLTPFEKAGVNAQYFASSFTFLSSLNELATRMEECHSVISGTIDIEPEIYKQAVADLAEVEILFALTQAAIFEVAGEA